MISSFSRASTRLASTAVAPATTRFQHSSRGVFNRRVFNSNSDSVQIAKAYAILGAVGLGIGMVGGYIRTNAGYGECSRCGQMPCKITTESRKNRGCR